MSKLRSLLENLGPAWATFLTCLSIGAFLSILILVGVGPSAKPDSFFALLAIAVWTILGVLFGGITWMIDAVSTWRSAHLKKQMTSTD